MAADPSIDGLFLKVIAVLNALVPAMCLIGLVAGGAMIFRRNKWGYYIIFVALAGLAVQKIFHN